MYISPGQLIANDLEEIGLRNCEIKENLILQINALITTAKNEITQSS